MAVKASLLSRRTRPRPVFPEWSPSTKRRHGWPRRTIDSTSSGSLKTRRGKECTPAHWRTRAGTGQPSGEKKSIVGRVRTYTSRKKLCLANLARRAAKSNQEKCRHGQHPIQGEQLHPLEPVGLSVQGYDRSYSRGHPQGQDLERGERQVHVLSQKHTGKDKYRRDQ